MFFEQEGGRVFYNVSESDSEQNEAWRQMQMLYPNGFIVRHHDSKSSRLEHLPSYLLVHYPEEGGAPTLQYISRDEKGGFTLSSVVYKLKSVPEW